MGAIIQVGTRRYFNFTKKEKKKKKKKKTWLNFRHIHTNQIFFVIL